MNRYSLFSITLILSILVAVHGSATSSKKSIRSVAAALDDKDVTSSPLVDTSIESPISATASKPKTNVSDISAATPDSLKKSIQAKVKKLKQLKLEAKEIAEQLRKERRIKAADGITREDKLVKLQKWKNRMRRRVKALIKRVNRLEKSMKVRRTELQGRLRHSMSTTAMPYAVTVIPRKNKHHQQKGKKRAKTTVATVPLTTTPETATSTSTTPATAIAQTPVITTPKIKTIAKRSHQGIDGSPCETHKDCAPGHCCHRFGALHGLNAAVCIRHDSKEGAHCEHSCACMGPLKCVKGTNPRTHASEQAHCRRLSLEDLALLHHSSSSQQKHSTHRYPIHY